MFNLQHLYHKLGVCMCHMYRQIQGVKLDFEVYISKVILKYIKNRLLVDKIAKFNKIVLIIFFVEFLTFFAFSL